MPQDPLLQQSMPDTGFDMPVLKAEDWLFNGRYQLIRPLGAGGMGVVWLAQDHTEETQVALKFLPSVLALQEREMQMLREEVRAGKELRHPRLVATYGLEMQNGVAAIVMEHAEGRTLKEHLEAQPRGFFEPGEIRAWVADITEALTYLHGEARRVHRDLKPANIMISPQGRARLMDFGISHRIKEGATRHSRTAQGHGTSSATLAYASPQQIAGRLADRADDLYSLGAMLYELLTGTPPFYRGEAALVALQITTQPVMPIQERRAELMLEGANATLGEKLPAPVEKIIQSCLAKERADRPADASQVLRAFSPADGKPIPAAPTRQPAGRRLAKAAIAVLLGLVTYAVLSGVLGFVLSTPLQEKTAAAAQAVGAPSSSAPATSLPPPPPGMEGNTLPPLPTPVSTPPAAGSFLDQGAVGKLFEVKLPGEVVMKFAFCPPGSFLMGSPKSEVLRSDDEDQVQVRISKGFWMGQTEVTQGQWQALMGSNPSDNRGSADLPVEQVRWEDAQAFINKLNNSVPLPDGWVYSLPTEAQWEYACRAGKESSFHFGNMLNGTQANCAGTNPYGTSEKGPNLQKTVKVGSYEPNAWGLYDMHGNVWEWCADWYTGHLWIRGAFFGAAPGGEKTVLRPSSSLCDGSKTSLQRALGWDFRGVLLGVLRFTLL